MHAPRNGFTLVEVLVALAVFAMLATGGVLMLSFTAQNQASLAARMERIAAFDRARALLASDLGQAADRSARRLDGLAWPAFAAGSVTGDGVVLSLVRRGWENPEGRARASVRYVEYALVEGRLERRARTMVDGAPLEAPAILFEGVEAVSVEVAAGPTFQPVEGVFRGPPPRAVALTVTLPDYGPVRMAFLVAGPE